jgi:preprotein translocase subunit SecE
VDEVTSEAQDGELDAATADMPEDDQELGVAPLDDERIATRNAAAGVQVPEGLLKSPLTRGLAEAYIELRKVTWPTRQDTWNMTIVVIVVSAIMAGLLALSDYGLGHALSYLVNLGLGK